MLLYFMKAPLVTVKRAIINKLCKGGDFLAIFLLTRGCLNTKYFVLFEVVDALYDKPKNQSNSYCLVIDV